MPGRVPLFRVVVAALVLALAAGCSSGSDDGGRAATSSSTASTVTDETVPSFVPEALDYAGFVARLQEICTDAEQGGDVGPAVAADSSVDDVDAASDAVEARLDLMRQMPVPDEDEAPWTAVEQAYDQYLTTLSELSDARASQDDAESARSAAELEADRSAVTAAVSALGATSCVV